LVLAKQVVDLHLPLIEIDPDFRGLDELLKLQPPYMRIIHRNSNEG